MISFHPIETPVILLISVFWLWMLVDCLFNKSLREKQKGLWLFLTLLILFTHILGPLSTSSYDLKTSNHR